MNGKILGIAGNDLYGNVDGRNVVVFACFTHLKYMNNYVIFAIEGEYNKKKLLYGSLHLRNKSIVTFQDKGNEKVYIEEFIKQYLNNDLKDFKIIDISDKEKVELVSYSEMECNNLEELDNKSIYRKEKEEEIENKSKSKSGLWVLLILLILLGTGLTVIYLNPALLYKKYENLTCTSSIQMTDEDLGYNYSLIKEFRFDENNLVKEVIVTRGYSFDEESYQAFLEEYGDDNRFIFDRDNLMVIWNYKEDCIMSEYNEIYKYMKNEGFDCVRGEYEE